VALTGADFADSEIRDGSHVNWSVVILMKASSLGGTVNYRIHKPLDEEETNEVLCRATQILRR
jgi:hypothetical protein